MLMYAILLGIFICALVLGFIWEEYQHRKYIRLTFKSLRTRLDYANDNARRVR